MAKLNYKNGVTSVILRVKLLDSASTTGAGKTALDHTAAGLIISTIADTEASATVYTSAGSTVEAVSTLGTFSAPTATKCRFKKIDDTNHPGIYEIQIADARWAVSNAKSIIVTVQATGAVPVDAEIQLEYVPADILRINSDADVKDYLVDLLSNGWDNTNNRLRTDVVAISGDSTAADNLEAMVDGTGGVPFKVTSFTITDGLIISATTGNRSAITATGDGSGAGMILKSGTSSADAALICQAQGTNDSAIRLIAAGTRHGIYATGGDTGHGVYLTGGATSGDGARFEATAAGHGLNCIGIGSGKYDINAGSLGALYAVLTVSGATTFTGAVTASNASNDIRVDARKLGGTTQTGRDVGLSVLISSGTGTGQLDVTSGRIKADTVYFGGSAGSFTTGVPAVNTTLISGSLVSTSSAQIGVNVVNAGGTAWGSGAITAASIANGAIDAATFAADVDAEILSYLVDDATRIDASALNTATVTTIPAILVDTAEIGTAGAGLTAVSTGVTRKRIAPGGGGDYTSLSAAITALASTAGIIELVCSAGNIGGGNLHSLTSASEVILRADSASRHRHDTAQPLSETAYFASNIYFNPTGSGPAKLRIEGLRSSGVLTGIEINQNAAAKTYDVEIIENLFHNSGGVGATLDQLQVIVTDGTLNLLTIGNTHFTTTTGPTKGYQVLLTATEDGADASRLNVRAYNNTGNTNDPTKVIDGISFGAENSGGGTAVVFADCRNNLMLGVAQPTTVGAINIQDTGSGVTTLTGSHNATNDSSASANGLTSGLTSVVAADVLSSPNTSNIQLSTAATRDAGYSLPQETLGRRVKSGSVWDIGSHEYMAGLSATQLADIYHADIYYTRDDAGSEDLYKAVWFKNGVRITSGITSPTIQVVKEADGTDLIASTAMTEIGTTEAFRYTATTTARQTAGESCLVIVGATIDGSARTFVRSLGRDSTA